MSRPTRIRIDLDALQHNYQYARQLSPDSRTIAVVKADAYGHGASDVALALANSADMFAVSCLEEAMDLRNVGISNPLLLLEGCFHSDELIHCSEFDISVVIHHQHQVDMLATMTLKRPLSVWLKVDTGMHRLGVMPENAAEVFTALKAFNSVGDLTLITHLASADEADPAHTQMQLERFTAVQKQIAAQYPGVPASIANSAGLLAWPQARSDWNRPGIMLYGLSPILENDDHQGHLIPVMQFESEVIAVRTIAEGESVGYGNTWTAQRESVIATVAAGYGDGYPRTAASGTPVLVNGERARLSGRVSMDMLSIDVTDIEQVQVGDKVELWGQRLNANEVAGWCKTSGYELVTRMPKRTPRVLD